MATLKPFGQKVWEFANRPPEQDAKYEALEGAVRSGKTWGVNAKILLYLCRYRVGGRKVILGPNKNSVMRNILVDLFDLAGRENYRYNSGSGELILFGSKWFVIGAGDEGSYKKLQGMTIGVCIIDEATNIPESAFEMLLTRLSPPGARLYMTLNPASPYHWLKTKYLDNRKLVEKGTMRSTHFTMDDNPNLTADYKETLKLGATGVFYQRYILGLWVVAEGAIYRDSWTKVEIYSPSGRRTNGQACARRPIWLDNDGGYQARTIAVDYGTHNACVFLDIRDTGKRIFIDREYYWDAAAMTREKTNEEYLADLIEFIGPRNRGVKIILDPSANQFALICQLAGLWVVDGENDVLEGIRRTSSLLALGVVSVNDQCANLQREMGSYAWDQKKAEKGDEEPVKRNDHAPDALRYYAFTDIPEWRLAQLAPFGRLPMTAVD